MSLFRTIVAGLALFLILPGGMALAQKAYFVSPAGNDRSGDGTSSAPWRTIQYSVDKAEAGDAVIVLTLKRDFNYDEDVRVTKKIDLIGSPRNGFRVSTRSIDVRGLASSVTGFSADTPIAGLAPAELPKTGSVTR